MKPSSSLISLRASRVSLLLLWVVVAAAGCEVAVRDESTGGAPAIAPPPFESPPFELTPAEKTRLLFPALLEPPDRASDRCVRSRSGMAPPPWLAEAAAQASCTASARTALETVPATPAAAQDLLTVAAVCDDIPAIKLALAAGAGPNSRDSCGWTALVAAAAGHPESVRTLLEAGARAKLESSQGTWSRPPLLAALIARDVVSARLLLSGGAPANAQTAGGRSALMFAAFIDHTDLVRELLRRRADPCHADSRGLTPVALARASGNAAAIELLGKAMLKCDASIGARK